MSFGIISEGPTDQIIIQNILVGFFNDVDITASIKPLQPLRDATDEETERGKGGWTKVLEYCQSQNFLDAFEQNEFLIIQIDTDVCEEINFDVKRAHETGDLKSDEELINDIVKKINGLIVGKFGAEKVALFSSRIIYAICHNEIECWLLPIYFTDRTKEATNNCIYKLNKAILEDFGFYLDKENKNNKGQEYWRISKPYMKNKTLMAKYHENISLYLFVQNLIKVTNPDT